MSIPQAFDWKCAPRDRQQYQTSHRRGKWTVAFVQSTHLRQWFNQGCWYSTICKTACGAVLNWFTSSFVNHRLHFMALGKRWETIVTVSPVPESRRITDWSVAFCSLLTDIIFANNEQYHWCANELHFCASFRIDEVSNLLSKVQCVWDVSRRLLENGCCRNPANPRPLC